MRYELLWAGFAALLVTGCLDNNNANRDESAVAASPTPTPSPPVATAPPVTASPTASPNPSPTGPVVVVPPPPRTPSETVTLGISNFGDGFISMEWDGGTQNCAAGQCELELPRGTVLNLTAIPSVHADFSRWDFCPDPAGLRCTLTADKDQLVFATFSRPLVLNPDVVILDDNRIRAIREYREGAEVLDFAAGTSLQDVRIGTVLVSEGIFIAPRDPRNIPIVFLLRVVSIEQNPEGGPRLRVEPGHLSDIVYSGTLSFGGTQGQSLKTAYGLEPPGARLRYKVRSDVSLGVVGLVANKLFGDDKTGHSAKLESASLEAGAPEVVFDIDFNDYDDFEDLADSPVTSMRFGVGMDLSITSQLRFTGPVDIDLELNLPKLDYQHPIAPPLFLGIAPRVAGRLKVDKALLVQMTPSFEVFAGANWKASDGWVDMLSPIDFKGMTLAYPEGADDVSGGIEMGMGVEFYPNVANLAGLFVRALPRAGQAFRVPPDELRSDDCQIETNPYLRLTLDAGAKVGRYGIGAEYRARLLDADFDLGNALCYPSGQATGNAIPPQFGSFRYRFAGSVEAPTVAFSWDPWPFAPISPGAALSLQQFVPGTGGIWREVARFEAGAAGTDYEVRPSEEKLASDYDFNDEVRYRLRVMRNGGDYDPQRIRFDEGLSYTSPDEYAIPIQQLLGPDETPPGFDNLAPWAVYVAHSDSYTLHWPRGIDDRGEVAFYVITAEDGWRSIVEEANTGRRERQFSRSGVDGRATNFKIVAVDKADNFSAPLSLRGSDVFPPSVPGNLSLERESNNPETLRLSWDASVDDFRVDSYRIHSTLDNRHIDIAAVPGERQVALLPDAAGVTCVFVTAVDSNTRRSAPSTEECIDAPGPPDTEPPTAPALLEVRGQRPDVIALRWQAASDNRIVYRYRIYAAGNRETALADLRRPVDLLFNLSGQQANLDQCFVITALDFAGNESPPSKNVCGRIDTIPPHPPARLQLQPQGGGTLRAVWSAGQDEYRLTAYELALTRVPDSFTRRVRVAADTLSYDFGDLAVDTEYCVSVQSLDSGANLSAATPQSCILVDAEPPTAPTDVRAQSVEPEPRDLDSVLLSWTPGSDNIAVTEHEIYRIGPGGQRSLHTTVGAVDSVHLEGLDDGTEHCFEIVSLDAWRNRSSASEPSCAYTWSAEPEQWTLQLMCIDDGIDLSVAGTDLIDLGSQTLASQALPGLDPNIDRILDIADLEGNDTDGRPFRYHLMLQHLAQRDRFSGFIDASLGDDGGELNVVLLDDVGGSVSLQVGARYFENGSTRRSDAFGVATPLDGSSGDTGLVESEETTLGEGCRAGLRLQREAP